MQPISYSCLICSYLDVGEGWNDDIMPQPLTWYIHETDIQQLLTEGRVPVAGISYSVEGESVALTYSGRKRLFILQALYWHLLVLNDMTSWLEVAKAQIIPAWYPSAFWLISSTFPVGEYMIDMVGVACRLKPISQCLGISIFCNNHDDILIRQAMCCWEWHLKACWLLPNNNYF